MIARLKGNLISKTTTNAIIDCNGVGYSAAISVSTSDNLPEVGEEALLHTVLIPREDAMNLYGFWNEGEKEAFKILISVTGVGPKIALGILSSVSFEELTEYILTKNIVALKKLPGIGKKSAERLSVELQDKVGVLSVYSESDISAGSNVAKEEALSALVTLGYSKTIADKTLKKIISEQDGDSKAEDLIRQALSRMMS